MALPFRFYVLIGLFVLGMTASAAGTYKLMAGKVHRLQVDRDALAQQLGEAEKQRKADAALLTRLHAQRAAAARETARVRAQLRDALEANREWATQPVPKEVRDALEQP